MKDQSRQRVLLVTGGCGFIGSCFVRQAVSKGDRVVVLDSLTYAGHRENLEGITGPGSFELVVGDIRQGPLVADLLKNNEVDAVIHFAAESHVDRSIDSPSAFIETNIQGTFSLLNASLSYWNDSQKQQKNKKRDFRFVHISTDEVFGSLGPEGKFSETTPLAPNSPYSASKAAGDFLVRAWHHTYGLPTVTTNCSNNYGPRQFPEKLIPHMIQCALDGRPLPVYGDGGNVRDWIHVEDHCTGVRLALEKGVPGSVYCLGGNAEKNNLDVVKTICRILDRLRPHPAGKLYESGLVFVADRLGHDRRYAIDDRKAQKELSFFRRYAFEDGLAQTVQWYLDHPHWSSAVLKGKDL